jgi:hypothetical protein
VLSGALFRTIRCVQVHEDKLIGNVGTYRANIYPTQRFTPLTEITMKANQKCTEECS